VYERHARVAQDADDVDDGQAALRDDEAGGVVDGGDDAVAAPVAQPVGERLFHPVGLEV
jgi:hypothetical protein